MNQPTFTPTPVMLAREAERLRVMARLTWADGDEKASARFARLATRCARRANVQH